MNSDLVVELADGTYRLTAPLVFTAADSGTNGHTITWQAAAGAHPVLSGGKSITGWAVSDSSKNIWKASAPASFVTRQLYVDGKIATRARSSSISRSNMTFTSSGWTFTSSSLSYLNNLANPSRAELNIIGSWTNRYSQIQSVKSNAGNDAAPGKSTTATVKLDPGLYAVTCFIPGADGKPHAAHGMIDELQVASTDSVSVRRAAGRRLDDHPRRLLVHAARPASPARASSTSRTRAPRCTS